ncbi:MAG: ADP-ribosylglycohydrolase family protein [Pseudomonadota bacterium]
MASLERKLIKAELLQRREEGCDVSEISSRIDAAIMGEIDEAGISSLYDELMALPIDPAFPFVEPSTLDEIQAERPDARRKLDMSWDEETLYDKTYGAWLGRAAGCALGKPVEGWPKKRIDKFLTDANALPLDNYLPFVEKILPGIHRPSTRDNIQFMDRDDDLDFPILGLLALEKKGARMTSRTIAQTWLGRMPYGLVYTAENAAYRNFVQSIWPPQSAEYRNPFREWIGAQIRADIFGYAAPGWPEKAAELAFKDAAVSHTKNGIYGEMFVAAMIAAAYVCDDVEDIIAAGLGEIPENCRLAKAVRDTQAWCRAEDDWEAVWEKIFADYGNYHGVHTINNAALVVMGLYFGIDDFERGIVCTVRAGWDTDCTGATVGSILGVKFGAQALPEKWVGVLNDRLLSAVREENDNKISELAARTVAVAKNIATASEQDEKPNATLAGTAGGVWKMETGWGEQLLDFSKGTVEFINSERGSDEFGPYKITESSYSHPELKFSYCIDKGSWDLEIDFEGTVDEDRLEGVYYPYEAPARGRRLAKE